MDSKVATRDGWTRVRFGDVVENVNDQPKRSSLSLDTQYIAGEHVDENRLTIDRWGTLADDLVPPTFRRRFQSGDVLFHSRNLKKIAVPRFGGITGEKLFVLRSTSSALLQEFVPYVLLAPAFTAYAEASWSGSVNKFLNWTPLADYEFVLPPLATQHKVVALLAPLDECIRSCEQSARRLRDSRRSLEVSIFGEALGLSHRNLDLRMAQPKGNWRLVTGQELLDQRLLLALQDGNHGSQYPRSDELGDDGLPYISAADISDAGEIDLASCRRLRPERAASLRIPNAQSGDVILTNNATVGRVTQLPKWPTEIVASTSTTYYRCNDADLSPEYLRWFLESALFQHQLHTIMRQSTRNQVPITTQKKLLFAVPDRRLQGELAALRNRFLVTHTSLSDRCTKTAGLRRTLLEKLLV